jgi:hypothetical protein
MNYAQATGKSIQEAFDAYHTQNTPADEASL